MNKVDIENRLNNITGKKSVYYKNLVTNEEIAICADEQMLAASVIKIPIMIAFYNAVMVNVISEDNKYKLKNEDKLPSCGCLNMLHENIELTYEDLCSLMIILSDNTATNIMIRILGIDYINQVMKKFGFEKIQLNRLLFDSKAASFGIENYVSAKEIGIILERLYKKELLSPEYDEKMLEMLANQKLNGKIPFYFERKIKIAHKTGEDSGITHDVGIIFDKEPFILCCLGNEVKASTYEKFMQEIAWDIHLEQENE